MDYQRSFEDAIARLKTEGRYRVFANLERDARRFPIAQWRREGEEDRPREVTVWCSNDYLGMGGHPDADRSLGQGRPRSWGWRGWDPRRLRHPQSDRRTGSRACRSARQARSARLHLRLGVQSGVDFDHRRPLARLSHSVRRAQPQFDDRGRQAFGLREARLAAQ